MPEAEIRRRGGALRYRRQRLDHKYINLAIVPKAGPRGGHTVAGPVHEMKGPRRKRRRRKKIKA